MSKFTVTDASDPEQVKKAQKEQEDREKDLDYILKEPRGRRWLYELIYETCHADHLSHVPGDSDATSFNEGGRAIGAKLLEDIRSKSPRYYLEMLKENHFDEA